MYVHQAALVISPVLKRMCDELLHEHSGNTIVLPDDSRYEFEFLLQYLYSDEL